MELPNPEHFSFRDCSVAGEDCVLINPKVSDGDGVWTPDNLGFRSVILRKSDNLVISRGFHKFYNYNQQKDLYPDPLKFSDWSITEKVDGSLICYSNHNGNEIIRTRGAASVDIHETGAEIKNLICDTSLLEMVPEGITVLMEHTTPSHRIVIKYEEPKLTLLGVIDNNTERYFKASSLPVLAKQWNLNLPKIYTFNSIDEIVSNCKELKGMEGYVLSYNNNQNRIKLKGDDYLMKHRLKSNFDSLPHVLDYWFSCGRPEYTEFFKKVQEEVDYETARDCDLFMIKISYAAEKAQDIIDKCESFAYSIKKLDRKSAAQQILQGPLREYANILFNQLDGKEIPDKIIRTLIDKNI